MLVLILFIVLFVLTFVILLTFALGALSAAPWLPLPGREVERLIDLAELKSADVVYDLGCGDGRLLFAAVRKYQVSAVGFEIALLPYLLARLRWLFFPGRKKVKIHFHSFWNEPLAPATVVLCFLMPESMAKLAPKVRTELRPGARVVSYVFKLPGTEPNLVSRSGDKTAAIYRYIF
ncbi:MAG: class I SAM-dependent methyltransferase [Candidatus Kerfeldbacteria bacterium]|nr:class I SAM-dependent methyltransferase [Candidatus Kerfeldbacteria bacterium]